MKFDRISLEYNLETVSKPLWLAPLYFSALEHLKFMKFCEKESHWQTLAAITHPKWDNFHRIFHFSHTWENNCAVLFLAWKTTWIAKPEIIIKFCVLY